MSMYDNMKFADYEYRDFPKWIDLPNGDKVLVQSEEEAGLAIANNQAPPDVAAERARLLALADLHGVSVDKTWSDKRVAKTITDAGFDATHDPNA